MHNPDIMEIYFSRKRGFKNIQIKEDSEIDSEIDPKDQKHFNYATHLCKNAKFAEAVEYLNRTVRYR